MTASVSSGRMPDKTTGAPGAEFFEITGNKFMMSGSLRFAVINENGVSIVSDAFKIQSLFFKPLRCAFFFASLMEQGSVSNPIPVSMPNFKAVMAKMPDPVPISRTVE